jgi:prolyl-tRNA synthetase
MRTSQYLLATLREIPADAEVISQQLMLRAGMIRRLGSGLYTWLPLGLRVLHKVIHIIREEMNKSGALELLMPSIQPAELWQETERWDQYGPLLLKITDRQERQFCYGPTHEEVITHVIRDEIRSYKQLPITVYQIQTKFRDEIRPRFGVMRAREFLMKDAYSFHIDENSLAETYRVMYDAYSRIFTRLGLTFRAVQADSGSIGGNTSHEFQVLANSGEDCIAYSNQSDYAANIELAEAVALPNATKPSGKPMTLIDTPNQTSIDDICCALNVTPDKTIKTLIVKGTDSPLVALLLRGDHLLNEIKAEKHPHIASPLTLASNEDILSHLQCPPGFLGPIGLHIPIIADRSALTCVDFICGANQHDKHYTNVNWNVDLEKPPVADLRNVVEGDPSPDGQGHLKMARGIEVGHIFQLGCKYSDPMQARALDHQGKNITLQMGCYGIGVSRIVAAAIEQHADDRGILWPEAMAPFDIILVPIQYHKSKQVQQACDQLYQQLQGKGWDVLLDDRNERPGVMFADADLIGIPHRIVISERGLEKSLVEYKQRTKQDSEELPWNRLIEHLERIHQ